MAQWVKVLMRLAAKTDSLGLVPGTHMVEGEKRTSECTQSVRPQSRYHVSNAQYWWVLKSGYKMISSHRP